MSFLSTPNPIFYNCCRIALYWQGYDRLEMYGPNFAFAVVQLDQDPEDSDRGSGRDLLRQVLNSNGFGNVSRFRFALTKEPYSKWTLNLRPDSRVSFHIGIYRLEWGGFCSVFVNKFESKTYIFTKNVSKICKYPQPKQT
jgi:hypothetical protein